MEEISEAQYQELKWQRIYTQRLTQTLETETDEFEEVKSTIQTVKVWKIDSSRYFYFPVFNMNQLTLSFWVNGTISSNPQAGIQKVILVKYPGSQGSQGIEVSLSHNQAEQKIAINYDINNAKRYIKKATSKIEDANKDLDPTFRT